MSNSLYHYGVKGMKWGVRRDRDRSRRARVISEELGPVARTRKQSKRAARTVEELDRARGYADEGANIAKSGKKINNSIANMRATKNSAKDLSSMSDQELRDRVNRLNLERQYSSLTAEEKLRGHDYVSDTLDIAGNVLAATSSALLIAVSIKKLRG